MARPTRLHNVAVNLPALLATPDVEDQKKTSGMLTMNAVFIWTRIKCAMIFMVLMLIPLPITSTAGLLVVIFRPTWFKKLVDKIYADKND